MWSDVYYNRISWFRKLSIQFLLNQAIQYNMEALLLNFGIEIELIILESIAIFQNMSYLSVKIMPSL